MMIIEILEGGAILVTLFFFALSSIFDFKTREVDDWVWITYGIIGSALTIARLILDPSLLFLTAISIGITVGVSLGLFYFGLFGGADAKAILCLGVTVPLAPSVFRPFLGYFHPFFPLAVVMISFICSASLAIWFGLRNVIAYFRKETMFAGLSQEPRWKKIVAMVTGYPVPLSKLSSMFYLYPLEEIVQDPENARRSLRLFVDAESDRTGMVNQLQSFPGLSAEARVWATPGLPMLFFILVGLIVTLVLGDVVFSLIGWIATRKWL